MTEAEWLACTDPQMMLEVLRGKASDRKLRLFACACCRYFFSGSNVDSCVEEIIEPTEWYADGLLGEAERQKAEQYARDMDDGCFSALYMCQTLIATVTSPLSAPKVWDCLKDYYTNDDAEPNELDGVGCRTLLDIFGTLPFRPVIVEPSWLVWNEGAIPKLAQAIYDDRAFDRLRTLAAALEKAGCTNRDILNHCRPRTGHVLGCWVLDLLLGKK
jgi:hypothetical protein